ncbi:MAG: hypothetical protein JO315_22260 [Acidobacteria bacterium]|nr:hypothetical protein [Acidobacteriota bacterium]
MEREELKLSDAVSDLLDECRMVLPGIQALFGFQMIAVFNNGFFERLAPREQELHLSAIVLVVVAIALLMTPAALHRQAEPREATDRFLSSASRLLLSAMVALAGGISLDVFLVLNMVLHDSALSGAVAAVLFALFLLLWFAYPRAYRASSRRQ